MLKFFKRFRSSMKFMDRVSDEIGVDRKVFQTALTEMEVNFATYEQFFSQWTEEKNEATRLKKLCMLLIPKARLGAARLTLRFGEQPELETLVFRMIDYQEENFGVLDDPETYRRNSM